MSVSFSTAGLCLLMQPVEHGASSQLYFSRTGMKDISSFAAAASARNPHIS